MGRNSSGSSSRNDSNSQSKADRDNHSNQLNSNNDAYWQSRGESGRPDNWDGRND